MAILRGGSKSTRVGMVFGALALLVFFGGCKEGWGYSLGGLPKERPEDPDISLLVAEDLDHPGIRFAVFSWGNVNQPAVHTRTGRCFYKGKEIRFPEGSNCALIHKDDKVTFLKIRKDAFCNKWKNWTSGTSSMKRVGIGPFSWEVKREGKSVVNLDKAREDPAFRKAWEAFLKE